jgi:hypothetical protein
VAGNRALDVRRFEHWRERVKNEIYHYAKIQKKVRWNAISKILFQS